MPEILDVTFAVMEVRSGIKDRLLRTGVVTPVVQVTDDVGTVVPPVDSLQDHYLLWYFRYTIS